MTNETLTEQQAFLILNALPNIGPITLNRLLEELDGDPRLIFSTPVKRLESVKGVGPAICGTIANWREHFDLAREEERMAKSGASFITPREPAYPKLLKEINDPPIGLYRKGQYTFEQPCIAIVGSRRTTLYGQGVAKKFGAELARLGFCVVSGLARGIDTAAHEGALAVGGKTAAVLGCGIDCIYPSENESLATAIAESGAVVSEFPPGTGPEPFNFPRRNRIISGLSAGVLVVEGGEKSGGLITASYALQQGRDVFAVPGPVNSPLSRGTFNLLREGAIPARSGHEIADALSLIANPHMKGAGATGTISGAPLSLLSDAERGVYELLTDAPRRVDELSEIAGRPVMQLFDLLLMLELKGFVRQLSGQQYVRA